MPCELVQHFSPASPLLVGGVLPAEEGTGHLQLRLKRHRWFPRILKTRDPLVFSIGACRQFTRVQSQGFLGMWSHTNWTVCHPTAVPLRAERNWSRHEVLSVLSPHPTSASSCCKAQKLCTARLKLLTKSCRLL